ncbi:MAG: AAA family ATPase [Saprospiraceae bacterium]|nr:AAA family ATPase [Pyrinomonadaceae bacterium]
MQRPLFGPFWNEGELSILFADTGKGKSILAVQIGQSIASGVRFEPFELSAPAQRVVYFDFELGEQQFASRYCAAGKDGRLIPDSLPFADNFIRASPRYDDPNDLPPEYRDYTEYLTASLVQFIEFTEAKVVIIDNITWLNGSTQSVTAALRLMKALKSLKTRLSLSILVLAHTPKRYGSSPMTINDLQGSKMLANFADNIFAMGASHHEKDIRYLKHLKLRNAALQYDASQVCTLRLGKLSVVSSADSRLTIPDLPRSFLGFEFIGHARERDHLGWYGTQYEPERQEMMEKARNLKEKGKTQREIAETLGISPATVSRYLGKYRER